MLREDILKKEEVSPDIPLFHEQRIHSILKEIDQLLELLRQIRVFTR